MQYQQSQENKTNLESECEQANKLIQTIRDEIKNTWKNVAVESSQAMISTFMQGFAELMLACCFAANLNGMPLPEVKRIKPKAPDKKTVSPHKLYQLTHAVSTFGKTKSHSLASNPRKAPKFASPIIRPSSRLALIANCNTI